MSRKSTRYAVTINGQPATLHFIAGLYQKTGILMPGGGANRSQERRPSAPAS